MKSDLYRAWERVRDDRGAAIALTDAVTGGAWDFFSIQAEIDALPPLKPGELVCPSGYSTAIVFETLRAWRDDAVLCPIERGGDAPDPGALRGLPTEVRHLKLTSGTAAGPRLVAFRGDQLAADARKIVRTMGLRADWPNLGVVSLSHSYGYSNLVLPLLLHGIPLHWLGDPLPAAVRSALEKPPGRWTLPAVPAMWRVWHESGILDRGRVAIALSAGAPLPPELAASVAATGGPEIHDFYGSSECGGITWDGAPLAETALSIDGDGCLLVRGPSVGVGYWPGQFFEPGCFVTGDLAEIDSGGRVRLLGRRDDVINVAGRKVSPATVEQAIATLPGVRQALVFGIPSADPVRGQEIVAVVAADAGIDPRRARLDSLASHERPRHWWLRDDLAPDARGKLSRRAWRERFLESRGR